MLAIWGNKFINNFNKLVKFSLIQLQYYLNRVKYLLIFALSIVRGVSRKNSNNQVYLIIAQ
jgi:hypothetical protein